VILLDPPDYEAVAAGNAAADDAGAVPATSRTTKSSDSSGTVAVSFDPGAHTVAEVEAYIDAHPDEEGAVLDAERAGKNRASLVG
jgi:hypothetical protein